MRDFDNIQCQTVVSPRIRAYVSKGADLEVKDGEISDALSSSMHSWRVSSKLLRDHSGLSRRDFRN